MKPQTLFFFLAASVALCQGTTGGVQDLVTTLQSDPNTIEFADLLVDFPDLLTGLSSTKQYTVFAPSNAAVGAFRASMNSSGTLLPRSHALYRRSISSFGASIALLFTDRSNQANLNTQPTNLITNLTDPAFVNLGPEAPASTSVQLTSSSAASTSSSVQSTSTPSPSTSSSVVPLTSSLVQSTSSTVQSTSSSAHSTSSSAQSTSSSAQSTSTSMPATSMPPSQTSTPPRSTSPPSAPGDCPGFPPNKSQKRSPRDLSIHRRQSNDSTISIYSGFGNVSRASMTETSYSMGAVRQVDSFFTLFGDLPSTLQQVNGNAFSKSLSQAGTLDSLSNTPRITIFVPSDSVLQGRTLDANALKRYVLLDTYATTPSLTAGSYNNSGGDSVNVAVSSDGTFTINNANIIGPNVMIKNGVIHFIDNVFSPPFTGFAVGVKIPVFSIIASVLAIALSYTSMAIF